MKLLVAFGILLTINATAQTAIIAHKSHSGNYSTFFIDPNSNFGEPPPRLVQVVRWNDTMSIEVYDDMGYYFYDTVYNNKEYANYELNIDSIQNSNPYRTIEYINFKYSADSLLIKKQGNAWNNQQVEPENEEIIAPVKTKKKHNKGLLLVLLLFGGGLLGFKVFSQKSVVPNAA